MNRCVVLTVAGALSLVGATLIACTFEQELVVRDDDGGTTDGALLEGASTDTATGDSSGDGGVNDSGPDVYFPPSCRGGGIGAIDTCESTGLSCCASLPVTGGTFKRGYDGVDGGSYTDPQYVATISDFRLDAFEVTVGRFRNFVGAVVNGYRPAAGAGKHTHLAGGNGLNNGTESGWDTAWNANLASTSGQWTTNLTSCNPASAGNAATWTSASGAYEAYPIDCVTWYEAYAFCIWDDAFLPSEAEWNYAAAGGGGGDGQRSFPWSNPSTSRTIDYTYASYNCLGGSCGVNDLAPVGYPKGAGKWLQLDLAGGVAEWTLDWNGTYPLPCNDCAALASGTNRVARGGSYFNYADYVLAPSRFSYPPDARVMEYGVRCARVP